jgi:hypothetical protein
MACNEYEEFEYGSGNTYGSPPCADADTLFTSIDTPAHDLVEVKTSLEFVVNEAYLDPNNYSIVSADNTELGVRGVVQPNPLTSNRILLVTDRHIAGVTYSITLVNLLSRAGSVLPETTGVFIARDSKSTAMLSMLPTHFDTSPFSSTFRHIIQALAESDDRIGGL